VSIMGVGDGLEEDCATIPGKPPAELEDPNGCGCVSGGGSEKSNSELELAKALRSDEELPNVMVDAGAALELELAYGAAELEEEPIGPCCVGGSTVRRLDELEEPIGEKEELEEASCLARDELEEPIGCVTTGIAEELEDPI
jgi:hypothetical protein